MCVLESNWAGKEREVKLKHVCVYSRLLEFFVCWFSIMSHNFLIFFFFLSKSHIGVGKTLIKTEKAYPLTGAQCPLEAQAVEVVTFAVLSPDLTELIPMAGALSAQAVSSPAADRRPWLRDAVGVIGWTVVLHRTLAPRAQAPRVTLTHAALVGPVAVAAEGAVGFGVRLAVAAAGEVHGDLQRVLETSRLDGERVSLLFGTDAQLRLHAERHLKARKRFRDHFCA